MGPPGSACDVVLRRHGLNPVDTRWAENVGALLGDRVPVPAEHLQTHIALSERLWLRHGFGRGWVHAKADQR